MKSAFVALSCADEELVEMLRLGRVAEFNLFRLRNPHEFIHLFNTDLRRVNLDGVNFEEALLEGVCLDGASLRGASFERAKLRYSSEMDTDQPRDLILRHADLRYANLKGATLIGVDLRGANLHGANLRVLSLHSTYMSREQYARFVEAFQGVLNEATIC